MTARSEQHAIPTASADGEYPGFLPTRVAEVELCEPLPAPDFGLAAERPAYGAWLILVRLDSEPLGIVRVQAERTLSSAELAAHIWEALGEPIRERAPAIDREALVSAAESGLDRSQCGGYAQRRAALAEDAPGMSVVLCTRDRPDGLRRTLEGLRSQAHTDFEVVVVDNASVTDETREVAESYGDFSCRYVREPRPGLSWARNRGVEVARHDVLAFIDDDEIPDAYWLVELALGFKVAPNVGCVTGMILPAEIETKAQEWFEQYGGHSKGRMALEELVFDASANRRQHPLYPLPAFGAGGNMAFTRAALARIGNFDPALGAGTPARGAEDTAAFSDVMLKGYKLVHRPAAFTWHRNYPNYEGLRRQVYGYGVGLASYYIRALLHYPFSTLGLLRMLPAAIRDYVDPKAIRREKMTDFPDEVLKQHFRGMLRGIVAYPISVRRQRAIARKFAR
jgi:glycosyltransferase involved in cell wall biosynthesis